MDLKEKEVLYGRLDLIEKSILRILYILENDSKINHQGLVEREKLLEERVSQLEMYNKVNKAKSATYGTIAGFAVVVVWHLVKIVLNVFFIK